MSRDLVKSLEKFLVLVVLSGMWCCQPSKDKTETKQEDQVMAKPSLSTPAFKEFTVPSQGDSIFAKTLGEGAPILVIHGGPGLDHTYLLPHLQTLAEDHQLIFYDQRASGRSSIDVDSNTVSIQGFLLDIENIRLFFGLSHWTICGHSWGGFLALNYALTYPTMLDYLILVNPMPGSTELQEEAQLAQKSRETASDSLAIATIMQSPAFKNGEITAYETFFRALFANQFYDRTFSDSLIISFQPTFLKGSDKLRFLAKDISDYDIHSQLSTMQVPTLLIYGAQDPLAGHSAETYARYIPNVQLVIVPQAGHFPFIEQKETFFAAVHKFLDHENI